MDVLLHRCHCKKLTWCICYLELLTVVLGRCSHANVYSNCMRVLIRDRSFTNCSWDIRKYLRNRTRSYFQPNLKSWEVDVVVVDDSVLKVSLWCSYFWIGGIQKRRLWCLYFWIGGIQKRRLWCSYFWIGGIQKRRLCWHRLAIRFLKQDVAVAATAFAMFSFRHETHPVFINVVNDVSS